MPADFREFFDLRRLDSRQLGEIEYVLMSPAYEHSFKPYLRGVLRQMETLWKDRSQARKDQYPDDMLGGAAIFGEGLLKFFDLILNEASLERVHDSMSSVTNEQLYDLKRERGEMKPVVGLDQPAEPEEYNPADDY